MRKKHYLIIVPGLGDNYFLLKHATKDWEKKYKLTPYFHAIGWKNKKFTTSLKSLIQKIDSLSRNNNKVSLLGCSAGGSAVLNAFVLRRKKIYRVINNCGRLRRGKDIFPSLGFAARGYPAFKDSVLLCEKNQKKLTKKDLKKIMTIRALVDEVVPSSTTIIQGAKNIEIFSIQHTISIYLSISVYSKNILQFLQTK